eukprot:CAMPEP_0116884498 /NCGR_PEP_ID=MMETSP0463-20121206/17420_1 /TAXON_ID=181622 /ORGANISM="Strombidinopsis sp, Strain SopsisLIS2011" /LENGTH=59 /DNA_ID=CAMNT_0004541123 /DNA_START=600 /DNA_END=779 /DNA_ORIENTATION=+
MTNANPKIMRKQNTEDDLSSKNQLATPSRDITENMNDKNKTPKLLSQKTLQQVSSDAAS